MSKVVTILGGNGYIGRRCIESILHFDPNATVKVISRSGIISSYRVYSYEIGKVEFIKGDCLNPESFVTVIEDSSSIIHSIGALLTTKPDNDPGSYNMMNKETCLRVAKIANECKTKKRLVYISSAAGLPFPLSKPFGGYIQRKRETEEELVKLTNLDTIILRPGFVVDAKDRAWSVPLKFPVDGLNMLDQMLVKKISGNLSNALTLPGKSIPLEIVAGYAALGSLGELENRIYYNEEMIENFKNLNRL